jgi:signal transduction histidine kinase
VNPAFENLTGLKVVPGRRLTEVAPSLLAASPDFLARCGRVAAGGGPEPLEARVKPLDGWFAGEVLGPGPGEVLIRFRPSPGPGATEHAQRMESLGLLAGGVAHDINNVLGAILALATLHRRKAEAGTPLRRDLETITEACLRGGSLVTALLGFARQDLREERPVDLNGLVREELRQLERTTDPHIQIQQDLGAGLGPVQGDAAALAHAFRNLCVNALEAMPGGGTLTVRTRLADSAALLLEVEDTGSGMAPEVLRQAMLPFYTTKPAGAGSGLGLAIVYGTIKAHRGTLDLASEPGKGSLARLRFPAPLPEPGEPPA